MTRVKSILAAAALALAVVVLASPAPGQAPKKYATGLKKREDLGHLKAMALARHGLVAQAIPPATERQWDSRKLGVIGPVKDQGQCGSCWDFSGVFVVETAFYKAGVLKPGQMLSEQFVLSCGRNGGCNGDDNTTVLKDAKGHGLPLTADYGPYMGGVGRCKYTDQKLYKVDDWGFADPHSGRDYEVVGNTQLIKNCIKEYGAVGCAIAADDAFMNVRPGQVFHGRSTEVNHDVALVGWDDDKGAWILRNSWGDWCDGGYCLIAYGANMVGVEPVWAVVNNPNPPPPPVPPAPPPAPQPCPPCPDVDPAPKADGHKAADVLYGMAFGFVIGGVAVFFLARRLHP